MAPLAPPKPIGGWRMKISEPVPVYKVGIGASQRLDRRSRCFSGYFRQIAPIPPAGPAAAGKPRSCGLTAPGGRALWSGPMIVSASYRTDIPAFYGDWFRRRLEAGFALVANPYGGRPYRVELCPPALDGFVFWTRNAAPFRPALEAVRGLGLPFVVQYTLTGYPRALETSVPSARAAIGQIVELAARHGPRAVVWRYDPILLTGPTDVHFHRAQFARLAAALEGAVDEAVVSFAQLYAKTRRNLDAAARRHGFAWRDPELVEKRELLGALEDIARGRGMALGVCSQPEIGGRPARCIDAGRLGDVAGRALPAREKGNRPGCLCAESRDLGAYDSCPHGCVYCYAVASRARARARRRAHDPASEFLFAPAPAAQPSSAGGSVAAGGSGALATATMAGRSSRS
jgi:hypothetical protein